MKKILLLAIILLSGCGESAKEKALRVSIENLHPHPMTKETVNDIEELVYKGCTYIVYKQGHTTAWGTHMGNCPNPIHKYNKVDSLDVQ